MTIFPNVCLILSDLWLNYRNDNEFEDFFTYNDIGLPLAFAISEGMVESTPVAEQVVQETFFLLLSALGAEDTGFESLDDILSTVSE